MFVIYWLINENKNKTYVGFSDDIRRRIEEHRNKAVRSTKYFGNFTCFILERIDTKTEAIKRERYWKSCAGRKKLKKIFEKVK